MMYLEITVEEALKLCKKNSKVLVAIKDLETNNDEEDIVFVQKPEYSSLFKDVKTVSSLHDDFVEQLNLYTVKQDIRNIRPHGLQKIILLKE